MKKYRINGSEMVKVSELRHEIKKLLKSIETNYRNFDKDHQAMVRLAYNDIVKVLYREELANAKTPDEIRAILEMPGEYVVYRTSDENPKEHDFFIEWQDGKPIVGSGELAMVFTYESKAEEIAERLGNGFRVLDISKESIEESRKLLSALFGPSDEGQVDEE